MIKRRAIYLNEEILEQSGTTIIYYEKDTKDKNIYARLIDSEKNFICNFYSKESLEDFLIDVQNVKHISGLVEIGLCLNVMWANNLADLYVEWLDYCEEDKEEYSYQEFIDNIPINVIKNNLKQVYFIINYTEV
jgi:hypothetical protein